MRWLQSLQFCIVIGIPGLISSCVFSEAESACGINDELSVAVFKYQFENNRSAAGTRAGVYFLAVEDDRDPSEGLLKRFAGHKPPVRPLSDFTMSDSDARVADPQTGEPGLIFRIYKRSVLSNREAIVEGGYYEANLSASWITMRAECQDGTWRIERIGPEKIAGLTK